MNDQASRHTSPPDHLHLYRVTYRMSDQMSYVYYSNYLEFFEMGRTELLRARGLTYRQMESEGYVLPVIHCSCDYLAPARYDDLLEIRTWIDRLTRVRIDFSYEIARQGEDKTLCRGVTRHAFISPDGRPRRLTDEWLEMLKA